MRATPYNLTQIRCLTLLQTSLTSIHQYLRPQIWPVLTKEPKRPKTLAFRGKELVERVYLLYLQPQNTVPLLGCLPAEKIRCQEKFHWTFKLYHIKRAKIWAIKAQHSMLMSCWTNIRPGWQLYMKTLKIMPFRGNNDDKVWDQMKRESLTMLLLVGKTGGTVWTKLRKMSI